jgi:hypothetical protein
MCVIVRRRGSPTNVVAGLLIVAVDDASPILLYLCPLAQLMGTVKVIFCDFVIVADPTLQLGAGDEIPLLGSNGATLTAHDPLGHGTCSMGVNVTNIPSTF